MRQQATESHATRCLVTGAAGFIGYHLSEQLLACGKSVLGVDNLNAYYDPKLKRDRIAQLAKHDRFEFKRAELADRIAVEELFADGQFEVVFHLAAQAGVRHSIENPHAYVESNLVAFMNVIEGCRHHGSRFVYASSSSVYGANKKTPFSVDDPVEHPVSLYAATKRSNELTAAAYAELYEMPITGLRFFTVYGPWGRPDMALYRFANAIAEDQPIDVYNHGQMRRDFTYIDDVVDGILKAANSPHFSTDSSKGFHRLYNLGNSQPVELGEMIAVIEQAMRKTAKKRMLPMQLGDVVETFADIQKSSDEIGYKPTTTLQEGIRRFVEWHSAYHANRIPAGA